MRRGKKVFDLLLSLFLSTELCDAGKKVLDGKYSKRKNKPNCERCENGTYMSDKNLEKECLKCPEWHEATGSTDDHGATKCECKCMKYRPSYINPFFVLWTFPSLSVGWVLFKRGVWFKFSFLLALSSVVCRPSSVVHTLKYLLLRNRWANQNQISYGAYMGWGNKSLFKWSRSHDQDGRHAHIW